MRIKAKTRVANLLDAYPEVETLLKWYDIELDDEELVMSLAELCDNYELDLDDLLVEIDAAIEDDEDDEDDDDDEESMDGFWNAADDDADDDDLDDDLGDDDELDDDDDLDGDFDDVLGGPEDFDASEPANEPRRRAAARSDR